MTSKATLTLEELDQVFVELDDYLHDERRAAEQREALVRVAYARHLETNAGYRRYAERCGASLDAGAVELDAIPLLPSALFKRPDLELCSVPRDEVAKWCTSSGTAGSKSIVPRDEPTLLRFLGSVSASFPALYGIDRGGGHQGIVLGPTTEDAGDLWFSYAIACMSLLMRTGHFERGGEFDLLGAAGAVRAALGAKKPFVVIGPPFRIADLCQELGRRGLPAFVEHSFVVSAGGWKGRAAETIDAATFRRQVAETLGAADETVVRDSFNMVELNTVIHECPHHRKHVPPWLLVQARDPRTNEVLPAGQTGVLAFLDATADSYPGFVLSEDFGRVLDEACPCGRVGPQVEIVRRINRIEARGCALKMASGSTHTELEGHQRFYASVHRNPDLYR